MDRSKEAAAAAVMEMCSSPFSEEEMSIDRTLGFPKAYGKLCRDPSYFNSYRNGPPFTFYPFNLPPNIASKARGLDQMFPIVDLNRKPIINPKRYADLLWKRLNHLGNAGFDPAKFRVDVYGNVLYFYADSASPLAWNMDHWFPYSRGGKTVPSNLRILQWQVCEMKRNKLEFLVPWWDFQLGISINQFLSIFASHNSDFRKRGFSFLFDERETGADAAEDASYFPESHSFPVPFEDYKNTQSLSGGLAPAAIIVLSSSNGGDSEDAGAASSSSDVLRNVDLNTYSAYEKQKSKQVVAASSISADIAKWKEETKRKEEEMRMLDEELMELKKKNDEERIVLQDLEVVLIRRKRRVEKCRRLSEAQASYKSLLEKMVRDAMHQSVVYKEQIRLNQAATQAVMARLEAQKALCDTSQRELTKRFKQREEIENQIKTEPDQVRKRSRVDGGDEWNKSIDASRDASRHRAIHRVKQRNLPRTRKETKGHDDIPSSSNMDVAIHKELRKFLEEEKLLSEEGGLSMDDERQDDDAVDVVESRILDRRRLHDKAGPLEQCNINEMFRELKLEKPQTHKDRKQREIMDSDAVVVAHEIEEYDGDRLKIGKKNVDNWLEMLLANTNSDSTSDTRPPEKINNVEEEREENADEFDRLVRKLSFGKRPVGKEIKILRLNDAAKSGGDQQSHTTQVAESSKANADVVGDSSLGVLRENVVGRRSIGIHGGGETKGTWNKNEIGEFTRSSSVKLSGSTLASPCLTRSTPTSPCAKLIPSLPLANWWAKRGGGMSKRGNGKKSAAIENDENCCDYDAREIQALKSELFIRSSVKTERAGK